MVAYTTGSNPFEIGDLGSKVKVTLTENVRKNDEKWWKNFAKNSNLDIFEIRSHHSIGILLPSFWYQIWLYCTINDSKTRKWKILEKYFWLKIFCEDANSHGRPSFVFCVIALTNCAIEACEYLTQLCNIYYNFCRN